MVTTSPKIIVVVVNVTPATVRGPAASGTVRSSPTINAARPGRTRKKSAPWMNIAFRLIQAAENGLNQPARRWWLTLPSVSLRKRTGTSWVRRPKCTDLITISEAYSQLWDTNRMRTRASLVRPRMPQWMSEKSDLYNRLRIQVVKGVPKYWCSAGIDPASIVPFQRLPITNS